ncbi:ferritin-like domain-containing protein [Sphingomonas adhaesiva]|uniref:ferritin-like domain-containing protein n=1 Tax=Sphingomonas adhaesiva TaxID=28212 RepID=UPI002FFD06CA
MSDFEPMMEALDARARRRETRRAFFTQAAGMAAGATLLAGTAAAQTATPTPSPSPSPSPTSTAPVLSDVDVLNFALNLEYLEANFYAFAVTGSGLGSADISGSVGTAGAASGGRAVTFTDATLASYAREIAADELAHVRFLRGQLTTTTYIAQPAIDLSVGVNSAFSVAARAAGLITGTNSVFDPYASEENFLLAAFLFEDVGVTAYKGAAPLIGNKLILEAAAGILAVEAYHAATIRGLLYRRGIDAPAPNAITRAGGISDARDRLDGNPAEDKVRGIAPDDDQGIATQSTADGDRSNIVPANENGIVYSRSPAQVLNIAYLNNFTATSGGFFPAGVNGTIKSSAAAT